MNTDKETGIGGGPLISLCMIVGNVDGYIRRCLESFAPVADEICMVRAIGCQEPDGTMDAARAFCLERDIPFREGVYQNRTQSADWAHVDDFAAARQQSFDLARGKYCFWCDSDDVLESGAERVRELAGEGKYTAYIFPYRIFGRGVMVPRERMVRRGSGRWRFPVHECFDFTEKPAPGCQDESVVVTHLPEVHKGGGNQRNLRILKSIPESEMTAGLWYHLQGELASAGDIEGSVKAARAALAHPEIGRPERYELFLNLARFAKAPKEKGQLLHLAYQADPRRREALGLLVCHALDYGRNDEGLAYARQMMGTPAPAEADWNERPAAYSWLGDEIYSQALRANGLAAEAEAVRQAALRKAGGPRIALVHATRGRAQQAALARKLWFDFAERPDQVEHIFAIDADDEASFPLRRMHHVVVPAGGGCVAAWNAGAEATAAPVILQLSDDWSPAPQWDELIMSRLGDVSKPKVLAISDGHREDRLLCMAICTRAYWLQDGFLFNPRFKGVFSDNWFTDQAYARGQVVEARDIRFEHRHPAFGMGIVDETYLRQNSAEAYAEGEKVYRELCDGNANPS